LKCRAVLLATVALFGSVVDDISVSGNALYDRQFDAPPLTVPASGGGAYVTTINAVTGDEILVARFSTFRIEGPED
jgi:hypothetical protein